jgi:hypothetical protein
MAGRATKEQSRGRLLFRAEQVRRRGARGTCLGNRAGPPRRCLKPVSRVRYGEYYGHHRSCVRALGSPPVALTLHVIAHMLAKTGGTEDQDLKAVRAGLVASPRPG